MDTLYSIEEAAKKLGGVSKNTIRAWLSRGRLPRTKVGRRTMISEVNLQRFVAVSTEAAADRSDVPAQWRHSDGASAHCRGLVWPSKILPKDAPSIDWLMPGAIHRGAKGLIVARPKAGKSMIALDLAICLSAGLPWMGIDPPNKVRVGVVSREDSPGMTMLRLKQFASGRSLNFEQLQGLFVNTFQQRASFSIENEADVEDLCRWIKLEQIEFCIFDVLNKLHSSDENDNTKMTAVMGRFDHIRTETGSDVAVIHHDAKNGRTWSK